MKYRLMFTLVIALCAAALAEEDKVEQPLRLDLDLVDGSRIIGTTSLESVPVQTTYAKMDLALKQIVAIAIAEDHETAVIEMRNGDKLKGVISMKPIKVETEFGKVSVGIEHIRDLRVVTWVGALPDTLTKSLVLCYSFDDEGKGKVTDKSGKKNDGDVKGAKWTSKGLGTLGSRALRPGRWSRGYGATIFQPGRAQFLSASGSPIPMRIRRLPGRCAR